MKLLLDRSDLEPEFKGVNCSQTHFEHFNAAAQRAIESVGVALFQDFFPLYDEHGRPNSYNVIYPNQQS